MSPIALRSKFCFGFVWPLPLDSILTLVVLQTAAGIVTELESFDFIVFESNATVRAFVGARNLICEHLQIFRQRECCPLHGVASQR
jgi:hypothetical protein